MTDTVSEKAEGTGKDELKEYIRSLLPNIDAYLSSTETALSQRPLHAGIIIVKDFVIKVSCDDNKDDFAEKPWFAILYHHIKQWYDDRYGPLLHQNPSGFARGVVLIRDFPIEMKVPLTRSRVETPGQTAWLYFPVDVESTEDLLEWLMNAPPLSDLDEHELDSVRRSAIHVATSLRSIRQYMIGVDPTSSTINGLLEGVLPEMESAASQIIRNDRNNVGPALWSIQMACERALKAFCQQKTNSFRPTHDLFVLFDDATPHGLDADRNLLKALPRSRDAVDSRYGLGDSRSVQEAMTAYNSGLSLVSATTKSIRRQVTFAGGGVLLRKAPWITLPEPPSDDPEKAS